MTLQPALLSRIVRSGDVSHIEVKLHSHLRSDGFSGLLGGLENRLLEGLDYTLVESIAQLADDPDVTG